MKTLSGLQGCWKLSVVRFLVLGGRTSLTVCFAISFAGALWAIAASGNYAWGQVTSDNTLGAESSLVTSPIPGTFQIDGGATRGTNLFHSLSLFSVPSNGIAYFNNALNIENIITRVTGGSVSNIDGLLRANGTANLFLINPNGIIFGSNAKLNINGSFITSTASSVLFADGTQFSATDPQTQPLLTVNVPIGLQLGNNPAPVMVQGSNLEVKANQNLVLVGGSVGLDAGKLTAPGGRIELGGLSTAGTVGLNENGSLNFPNNVARSDVSVTDGAAVNVHAGGGGFITINARNLAVSGGSNLRAGIGKDLGTSEVHAGDVEINASDTVSLDGTKVENQVDENAKGNAGNIKITAGSLFLSNDTLLSSETKGKGDAGNVIINTFDTVVLNGSEVETEVEDKGEGKGGNIQITTNSLSLVNDALLEANTEGKGDAGQIIISATDSIFLDRSNVNSQVEKGEGNSGGIHITTGSLFLSNGALLSSETRGKGNAGNVIINASDTVSLNHSEIEAEVEDKSEGKGGNIQITTNSLSLVNGALLEANTEGKEDAGQIIISATDSISLDRSNINSQVEDTSTGNSGGIHITTGSLFLSNGAHVSSETRGKGNAGNVIINASDTVSLNHSEIEAEIEHNGEGKGGNIQITTNSLSLVNGSSLEADTEGKGHAGNIIITAFDTVFLNGSEIETEVDNEAQGDAGNIEIKTNSLSLVNGASLQAQTMREGNAGKVIITATDSIFLDGSTVLSRVDKNAVGNAGGIDITTNSLSLINNAELNVSSFGQGNPGNLEIKADSIRLENQGKLTAQTLSGVGGNIVLQVEDILLLRDNSLISAQASGDAKGGNIDIDAGFIIAFPNQNNDIVASAQRGNGGNINITTQAIFGLEERSSTPPNSTNDIDASSEFGLTGNVSINTPDVDPSRGLVNLPVEPANVEVAQGCQVGGEQASIAFFNTGRGGLAPNPYEPLSSSNIWEDVPFLAPRAENSADATGASASPATPPNKIVEAQGWLIDEQGQVVLMAQMPTHSQSRCRLR
jgi:filamentous hemagglutinin family protein